MLMSKKLGAWGAVLSALVLSLGLAACGGGGSESLLRIEVAPDNVQIALGTSQQYSATAITSKNNKQDVSGSVTWASSDPTVATVNASGLVQSLKKGQTTISASYQSLSGSMPLTVTSAVITGLAITPPSPTIASGTTQQFTATASFSDSTTQNVSNSASWSSSAPSVATVDAAGLATSSQPGSTTISASYMGKNAVATLTVSAATISSIAVTPANPSIAGGTTQQFMATATFSDNSTQNIGTSASWTSSDPSIATIDANGLATSVKPAKPGTTTITAAYLSRSGNTTLTVTSATLTAIQVTPAAPSVGKGASQQFTAIGSYSDGTTKDITSTVVWRSSDQSVATISNAAGSSGLAKSLKIGSTTIVASQDSLSGTAVLKVTAATVTRIDVTPTTPTIPKGNSQQFTATAVYTDNSTQDFTTTATWSSSNTAVIEISNGTGSQGLSAAVAPGTATVTATAQGLSGSTSATVTNATLQSIQVTPTNATLAKGFSLQYTAIGIYSDNTNRDITGSVTWASSTTAATISNAAGSQGLATAGATQNNTIISATLSGVTGSTPLAVSNATLTSITLTPGSPNIPLGTTRQLIATGNFDDRSTQDLTSQASWISSDTSKATVSNTAGSKGLVTPLAAGSTMITATVMNAVTTPAVSGNATATISPAALTSIAITPSSASTPVGLKQAFTAMGTYSDNSTANITKTVTWSSSDTSIATISNTDPNQGMATAVKVGGPVTITAVDSTSGKSATASMTVTAAVLTSIAVTPGSASASAGRTQQFAAMGTYSDGTTATITTTVTWASSDTSKATISNASGSQGLATGVAVGSAKITAASGSVTSTNMATLTVTNAVPVSISVTPKTSSIPAATTQQFTATETFSDNSTPDQTAAVSWSSSNTAVADISNAAGSQGLATGRTPGTVTITATDSSVNPAITGNTTLTVTAAALSSITVTAMAPSDGHLPMGYTLRYLATGNYTDSTTQDLTTSVTWSTLNAAVATISNVTGSNGTATPVALGSTTVRAVMGSISGTASVIVTNATLASIVVKPANPTILRVDTLQFIAEGAFSDGSKLDITTQGTAWASSNTNAITINATSGLAMGAAAPATSTISATKTSVVGSTVATHTLN